MYLALCCGAQAMASILGRCSFISAYLYPYSARPCCLTWPHVISIGFNSQWYLGNTITRHPNWRPMRTISGSLGIKWPRATLKARQPSILQEEHQVVVQVSMLFQPLGRLFEAASVLETNKSNNQRRKAAKETHIQHLWVYYLTSKQITSNPLFYC